MRGIDVGAGTNLYPAMSMLPWCDEITLVDRSVSNVAWLENEVEDFKESWDPFWELFQKNIRYAAVPDPRNEVRKRAKVVLGDVFQLDRVRREIDARREGEARWKISTRRDVDTRWEIGTMFFVACSSIASTHLRVDRVRVEERRAQFEEIWMAADSKPGSPVDST